MKKFIALLLALAMVLSLAACSVEKEEAPAETQAAAPEAAAPAGPAPVEISLWTFPVGKWGEEATVKGWTDAFTAKYPHITVNVEYLDYQSGDDKLNTAIEGGQAPDLVMEGPERLVANWGAKGKMVNIADLFDETDKAELNPATVAACFADDATAYEYPLVMTAHCMAINKTVFEAAGAMQYIDEATRTWTTENFYKAIEAVYEHTGKQVGAVFCKDQGGDQGTRALINNLYGGAFTAADHSAYDWANDANIQALTKLYEMDAAGSIKFDPGIAGGDELALLYNGTLNMANCWNIAQQLNPAAANTGAGLAANGDEIMFLSFPSQNGNDAQLCGGIWGFGIFDNGDAARIDAAKTFIKYFCDSEATVDAVKAANYFAVRNTAEGTDLTTIWADNEIMNQYNVLMPMLGDYYQVTAGWTEARAQWWNMLQAIDNSDGTDIAGIVEQFETAANAAMAG